MEVKNIKVEFKETPTNYSNISNKLCEFKYEQIEDLGQYIVQLSKSMSLNVI